MLWECFGFNCKINFRKFPFLLAAVASILFSMISQLPYFEHYQLTNPSDIQQISDRLPTDATVPTDSEEQILLTVHYTESILTHKLQLENSSEIIMDLQERLSVKKDWSIRELDDLWAELVQKYSELTMLMPNHLSNSFVYQARKNVTSEELFQYAYSHHPFSYYLSVEFGQSLSLMISILFIIFFSTAFLSETKEGVWDVLHVNGNSPRKMIYGKYLSVFAMTTGCVCLNIISVNVMQCLYIKDRTFDQLLMVWANGLFYCIPTILFLSSLSVLLCLLFKNAILGVAALLLANFVSSYSHMLPNGHREQLYIAPFLFNFHSFFDAISPKAYMAMGLNRIAFCLIGIGMLELTVWVWKKNRKRKRIPKSIKAISLDFSLCSPKSFFFYNAKIILNKVKIAALIVIFSVPYFSINANTDIVNVSRSILLMTGWAAVILFSNIKSVEYADNTIDLYKLSAKQGRAVCIRLVICVITILLFTAAVFFLSLLRINPVTYRFDYIADIFIRMMISCLTCSFFLGSVTMLAGYGLQKTWSGLGVGLILNILLSQIKTASMWNLYLFYYFPGRENNPQWLLSILFYGIISFAIVECSAFYSRQEREKRVYFLKGDAF